MVYHETRVFVRKLGFFVMSQFKFYAFASLFLVFIVKTEIRLPYDD